MITIQFASGRTKIVSERRLLLTFLLPFLVIFIFVMILPRCAPPRRESSRTVAALRPTMERIANHGGGGVSAGAVPAGAPAHPWRPSSHGGATAATGGGGRISLCSGAGGLAPQEP